MLSPKPVCGAVSTQLQLVIDVFFFFLGVHKMNGCFLLSCLQKQSPVPFGILGGGFSLSSNK